MTAIAGAFRLDGQAIDPELLKAMTAPVLHRGSGEPDIQVVGNAGLVQIGMPATAPVQSPARVGRSASGRLLAVFDGRLDDVATLRSNLGLQAGQAPDDVDLVIAACKRWGSAAASHLLGDFAFAVIDSEKRTLLCARDPIGPRMLNYAVTGGAVYFGTEIKQLFQVPGVSTDLDEQMLGLFLCGAAQYGDATMFKQVKRLQGGYTLQADASGGSGHVSTSRFWDMREQSQIRHGDRRDYIADFKERFFVSVTDRLRGEGPTSILLSGGLDSGSVACVAGATAARHGRKLEAFYYQQSNPEFDELPFAREICDTYGISLTTINADDMWAMKPDPLASTHDEPFIVPFELLNQQAIKLASASGSRVALTGEGGDEGFAAGYMLYLRDWLKRLRLLAIYRDVKGGTPHYRSAAKKNLKQHLYPGFVRRMFGKYRTSVPPWLTDEFTGRTNLRQRLDATLGTSYMNRNYFTGRGSHPFHILWDHRAGSYGMEPAHPMWDLRIVEFLALIPPSVRLEGGTGKLLLKEALGDVLTPGLMTRQPFAAMNRLFTRGWHEEGDRFLNIAADSELQRRNVINATEVADRYRQYLAGDETKSARLFWSLVTDDWLQNRYPKIQSKASSSTGSAV